MKNWPTDAASAALADGILLPPLHAGRPGWDEVAALAAIAFAVTVLSWLSDRVRG